MQLNNFINCCNVFLPITIEFYTFFYYFYIVLCEPWLPWTAKGAGWRINRDTHHVERALRDRDRGDDGSGTTHYRTQVNTYLNMEREPNKK